MACVGVNGSPLTKRVRAGDRPMAMQYGKIPGLPKKVSRVVRSALPSLQDSSVLPHRRPARTDHSPFPPNSPTIATDAHMPDPLTRSSRCTGHCFCTRLTDQTLSSTRSGSRGAIHSTVQRWGVASYIFFVVLSLTAIRPPISLSPFLSIGRVALLRSCS